MKGGLMGRYADVVTATLTIFLIVAAVAQHALLVGSDLGFIDYAAMLAIGATYGRVSAANGYAAEARAAHTRLDKMGAPPADDADSPA
jgi:hypothetical protein